MYPCASSPPRSPGRLSLLLPLELGLVVIVVAIVAAVR